MKFGKQFGSVCWQFNRQFNNQFDRFFDGSQLFQTYSELNV
jgi:hypothetical protein